VNNKTVKIEEVKIRTYRFRMADKYLKPNSIMLSDSKLVADRFEAGREPASSF